MSLTIPLVLVFWIVSSIPIAVFLGKLIGYSEIQYQKAASVPNYALEIENIVLIERYRANSR